MPNMHKENHQVTLRKPAQRNLQDSKIEEQIEKMLESLNSRNLGVRGWSYKTDLAKWKTWRGPQAWKQTYPYRLGLRDDPLYASAQYVYEIYLEINYERAKAPASGDLTGLLRKLATRAQQPTSGKWNLAEVDGEPYKPSVIKGDDEEELDYAEVIIPQDWPGHFAHLYGLDPHVAIILQALQAGISSGWKDRFNCALIGEPGCGKSDVCQSLRAALGDDAVLEFDGTATTAAGAIKELTERDVLPRVLVVEEIEKAQEAAMSFLLSVLDLRANIRKITARANIQRDTKLFAVATVNDVPLFRKLQAGALASRFPNKLWFNRPDRDVLKMILQREVLRANGNRAWIAPTLDYCAEKGITDPRTVNAICLCGRDLLLDGKYQKMLEATGEPPDELTQGAVLLNKGRKIT
jgi:AAA domain (dynein-related subfamily)